MAPNWMKIENIFQYPSPRSMCSNASQMRRCAVELTGKNSVRPSTTPSRAASRYVFNHPPGKHAQQDSAASAKTHLIHRRATECLQDKRERCLIVVCSVDRNTILHHVNQPKGAHRPVGVGRLLHHPLRKRDRATTGIGRFIRLV